MRPYNLQGVFADLTAYLHVGLRCRAIVGEIFGGEGVKLWEIEITFVKTLQQFSVQFLITPTHMIKHFKDSISRFH
jgi:hypothetical protein